MTRRGQLGFSLAVIVVAGVVCGGCAEARIRCINLTDQTHTIELMVPDETVTVTLGPNESEFATITWTEPTPDDTELNFDYYIDGTYCGVYHIWDGELDREIVIESNDPVCYE